MDKSLFQNSYTALNPFLISPFIQVQEFLQIWQHTQKVFTIAFYQHVKDPIFLMISFQEHVQNLILLNPGLRFFFKRPVVSLFILLTSNFLQSFRNTNKQIC